VDTPVQLRADDSIAPIRHILQRLHRVAIPGDGRTEAQALRLLDGEHRRALEAAGFRYLGELHERFLVMGVSTLVFVDASETVMVHYEPKKKNYSLLTYFEDASLLGIWASQSMVASLGHTDHCVHRSGSGSLAQDLADHGQRLTERAAEALRPVAVSSIDDAFRLSQLYYEHIVPRGTALMLSSVVIIPLFLAILGILWFTNIV
jgi:hypothetical protein